jgi:hypothetical protein
MRDGLFGAESFRQANTCVQSNRLPHRVNSLIRDPLCSKEVRRGIGSVDLEPLIPTSVIGDAEVMQDATEEDKLVVVVDVTSQSPGCGQFAREKVTTDTVVGDESRGDVER